MEIPNIIKPFNFLNFTINKPKRMPPTTDTKEVIQAILVADFFDSFTAIIKTAYK